ncbi:acyltransferase family protein [Rhodohalobacter sp. 8-1]|uniref:acyltransferase family protein n=1 Tax=Rhodohalobacter sp. 8-1 TaxID=3131972 RepID=UPI0030EDBFCF
MPFNESLRNITRGKRLVSLDVFRGATIAAMILVNNPGTWAAMYPPLRHAQWHGWTITDLIFPFFLFIVGVSVVLAFTKSLEKGAGRGDLLRKTVKRSAIIFGLGLLMMGFPYFTFDPSFDIHSNLSGIRLMGVLQRIAICYLIASLLFLYVKPKTMAFITAGLLLVYWAVMMLIPVPGYGAGMIDQPHTNLSAWVDQLLIPEPHIYREGPYDPEGILSTIPAIATTLLGLFAGMILMTDRTIIEKAARLMLWGFFLAVIGYIWNWWFPINKSIWTSSYAIFTAGLAMQCFGACYWLIDVKGYKRFTRPFVVYGVNALIVFFVSGLLARTLVMIQIPTDEGSISLQRLIFNNVFMPLASEVNASLLYAITWIVLWYVVLSYMYKRKIFIKV